MTDDGPVPDTDDDDEGPAPLDRARRHRREWQLVIVLALLVVALVAGWRWWQDNHLVGSTTDVTLTWQCANHVFWTDPSGDRWLVGDDVPAATGDITMSSTPTGEGGTTYLSNGVMHVDTRDTATFTARNGAVAHLRRQPPGRFYDLACAIR